MISSSAPDVTESLLLPRCAPDEVLFRVKAVRFVDPGGDRSGEGGNAGQRKMVDLAPVNQAKEVEVTTQR